MHRYRLCHRAKRYTLHSCPYCTVGPMSTLVFQMHLRMHKICKTKPYICPTCTASFVTQAQSHFSCAYCPRGFVTEYLVQRHEKIHRKNHLNTSKPSERRFLSSTSSAFDGGMDLSEPMAISTTVQEVE
ncbi:hypothetical protein BIW11_03467 [Tropilaelaps mercedesae]|uniref:C2H2-type domain-containing protein n=1 Tax=Tropilaelaps mercedesae TaxID=418985 RepID=A0A1V9XL49_9ACAR|nr:hypothetical protein BIW11_03467 [Tropilaelaps mercedesae]